MISFWFFVISFVVVSAIIFGTWWAIKSKYSAKADYEILMAKCDKIDALVESAEIWIQIGSPEEARSCIIEAERLNKEICAMLGGAKDNKGGCHHG